MTTSAPPANLVISWISRLLLWLIVAALVVFAASGCSVLGVATESYVEDRVEALDEARVETAVAIVEPLEPIVPGITSYARERARGVEVRAPTPSEDGFPWEMVLGVLATTIGVGVPASVGATNHMRDKRRRQLNEATSVREAEARGYYADVVQNPKKEGLS